MKICNDCKKELPEDSDFCQYCGSKNIKSIIPQETDSPTNTKNKIIYKRCIDCGKELPMDSDFCQYCGSKRIASINNVNYPSPQTTNNRNDNFKKLFIVALIVAICAIGTTIYFMSLYNKTNSNLETYISKNKTLEDQLSNAKKTANSYKTKADNYDDIVRYSSNAVGYSNFYARDTILYKPKKQKVWIYQSFYATIWYQTSSSLITAEWGDWSGNWAPLTITYNGRGVEYVKIYNDANNKYFYIIVIG